jgi:cobalt-precorrin-6B (C15)-methyltransferase
MKWIKDKEFIRGNIPMTKFNIRVLTIGYLSIQQGDRLLDIGAGTGSISIEAALQGANVWAIERETEGISLINANNQKFNTNINIIKGFAPDDLPDIKFNKCFIGGSGGKLENIFIYLSKYLEEDGLLCGNFITINNLTQFIYLLKKYNYKDIETQLIQSAYMDKGGLMKGQNPIYIVKGVKSND